MQAKVVQAAAHFGATLWSVPDPNWVEAQQGCMGLFLLKIALHGHCARSNGSTFSV